MPHVAASSGECLYSRTEIKSCFSISDCFFLVPFSIHKDLRKENLVAGHIITWMKYSSKELTSLLFAYLPTNHLITELQNHFVTERECPRQQCKYPNHWTGVLLL